MTTYRRGVPIPMGRVAFDPETTAAYHADIDAQVDALFATASVIPGDGHAVRRSDGGLWLAAGHEVLWTIFGVASGCWWPVQQASGVVALDADAPTAVTLRVAATGSDRRPTF